jgi:exopolysaccharide production protein ExoZ
MVGGGRDAARGRGAALHSRAGATSIASVERVNSTTPKYKLQGIEAARGIAATLVVIYHAARHIEFNGLGLPWFGGIELFGHAGVDFFFVLSGFIILFVHWGDVGQPSAMPRYVERRCTRIYPLYWAVLVVHIALAMFGSQQARFDLPTIAANVTLFPLADEPIVGVAWTLQHEILFYALFAVALISRLLAVLVFAAWFALVGAQWLGILDVSSIGAARVATSAYNVQFLMGMAAAAIARRVRLPMPRTFVVVGALSFLAVGIAESRGLIDGYGDAARLYFGATAFLLVIGLAESERNSSAPVPRWLGVLGKASYAIYLGHLLAIGVVWKILERLDLATSLPPSALHLLLIAAGLAGGIALSLVVEYPLMGVARRLWARAFTPAVGGAAR